jgi:LacI family transcriptional regulator
LGVNPGTVSRALTNFPGISEETRRRVWEVADREGFRPRPISRRAVSIAALIQTQKEGLDLLSPYTDAVLEGMWEYAQTANVEMAFFSGSVADLNERGLIRRMGRRGIDGVVVINSNDDSRYLKSLRSKRFPYCCVMSAPDGFEDSLVSVDNRQVGFRAATHLLELGHRRVAVFIGAVHFKAHQDRLEGVRRAFAKAGIPLDKTLIVQGSADYADGFAFGCGGVRQLFRDKRDVTAIFTMDTQEAIGAIRGLSEAGKSVPADVSVVTCDDSPLAANMIPALTVMDIPNRRLGYDAMRRVHASLESGATPSLPPALEVDIIVRESSVGKR